MMLRVMLVFAMLAAADCSAQMIRRGRTFARCCCARSCCPQRSSTTIAPICNTSYAYAPTVGGTEVVSSLHRVQPIESKTSGMTVRTGNLQPDTPGTELATSTNVRKVAYYQSVPANGHDTLSVVNQRRRAAGLAELLPDPSLTATAQYKSRNRASRRITGHDGTSRGGARVEGVGYSSGGGANRFSTCHMYSRGYRFAGAAVAYDGSGRAYYTLLLR